MTRSTITLSADLRQRAQKKARERGVSLKQFVETSVLKSIVEDIEDTSTDSFLADTFVAKGSGPRDVASNHDRYLDEVRDQKLKRNGHRAKPIRAKGRR